MQQNSKEFTFGEGYIYGLCGWAGAFGMNQNERCDIHNQISLLMHILILFCSQSSSVRHWYLFICSHGVWLVDALVE